MKILGRKTELINVGGEKVYPQEVENIIQGYENVKDVLVFGEKHPLIGNIVCAQIVQKTPEIKEDFIKNLKKYCMMNLSKYKVPVKIKIVDEDLFSNRFIKKRK